MIVNIYPFEKTIHTNNNDSECLEMIDIGGPAMLRSAAKNYDSVTAICDIKYYSEFLVNLKKNFGLTSLKFRKKMAQNVFKLTSDYDKIVSNWLLNNNSSVNKEKNLIKELKYGENKNQKAKIKNNKDEKTIVDYQIHGKEMGYNNILDIDSGISCISEFKEPTCVIIKHNNPCGAASAKTIQLALKKSIESDKNSSFGGIVIFNRTVDKHVAKIISSNFFEAIVAPRFNSDSLNIIQNKKKLIVLRIPKSFKNINSEVKSITGGYLIQDKNILSISPNDFINVSKIKTNKKNLDDLLFALKICKHVKSNAIVFVKNKQTAGIGAGQMSRIDSVNLAIKKLINKDKGYVAASDAFFPFSDSIKKLLNNNCESLVQPYGSINDKKIIEFAKKNNFPLYFYKYRLFKH